MPDPNPYRVDMDPIREAMLDRAQVLSKQCQAIIHGQGQMTQGAVLADLLSLWIAGHICVEEIGAAQRPETEKMRNALIDTFMLTVRELVPESEKEIMAKVEAQGRA